MGSSVLSADTVASESSERVYTPGYIDGYDGDFVAVGFCMTLDASLKVIDAMRAAGFKDGLAIYSHQLVTPEVFARRAAAMAAALRGRWSVPAGEPIPSWGSPTLEWRGGR